MMHYFLVKPCKISKFPEIFLKKISKGFLSKKNKSKYLPREEKLMLLSFYLTVVKSNKFTPDQYLICT